MPVPRCSPLRPHRRPVDGDLEFVGRLAQADPGATTALAAWLDNASAVKGGTA
ncbi:hypothetical protein [Streptomyces sp. NPDC053431]|uniref:hypothetical protein n=1 Tax=Streptomyces sp. NPDC053431 TaxID=3365703 RepID=UPI0037CE21E0